MERGAPDQIAAKLLDPGGDGAVAVILAVRLAPPDNAVSVAIRTNTKFFRQPECTGRRSTLAIFMMPNLVGVSTAGRP